MLISPSMKNLSFSQFTVFIVGLVISLHAHAQDARRAALLEKNIQQGLTMERQNSVYWEKWNLKLSQAVQFVVTQDLKMGAVASSANRAYYFYRDFNCEISANNIDKPVKITKGAQYALVDYLFTQSGVEILLYARSEAAAPNSLDIVCQGINGNSKVKDLQQALLKVFELQPGREKIFGIF